MADAGYVYVLINPSMEGLVKIGKTMQNTKERAKKLSIATGVPTPFIVVFDAYFEDCSKAEEYVQARLEQKNYRVSSNREFFTAPVNEAVNAILEAQNILRKRENPPADELIADVKSNELDEFTIENDPPWHDVFELAEEAYYGLYDTLEDHDEALRLYKQAAKLGSPEACLRIGCIYRDNEELRDNKQALAYLKEGVNRGAAECYPEMAELFVKNKQFDNAHKCWSKYFEGEKFRSNAQNQGIYGYKYIQQIKYGGLPINHKETLLQIRDEILRWAEKEVEWSRKNQRNTSFDESNLLFIRYILYPEAPRSLVRGTIKWFEQDKGYGFIRQKHDEDVFLHESEIISDPGSIREGQQVEFEVVRGEKGPMACNVRLL